ncbi:MAG: proton-conducting transporter membrane subunit [Hyphomonadaceae bacterium]
MAIAASPGAALLFGALLALFLPAAWRALAMALAALAALFLMFAPDFGEQVAIARTGIVVTPVQLDALSQVFGLAVTVVALGLALFSAYRRDRAEDVAFMTQAGAALIAIFAGDLIFFAAAAQVCLLAGAVMTMRAPRGLAAGLSLLGWSGVAGVLIVAGAALEWAQSGALALQPLDARTPGGALLLLGFLIMAAGPVAHVWLKAAAPRASAVGAAALVAFPAAMALYALARAFQGEPLLVWIGVVMALWPLPFAAAARDPRTAMAYGAVSQGGAVVAALGVATPLASAGAVAYGFVCVLHTALACMAVGFACERAAAGIPVRGLARAMPITAAMAIVAALSALAAPGFAGFAARTLIADAVAHEQRAIVYWALAAANAGAVLHIGLRTPYDVFFAEEPGGRPQEKPFLTVLALSLLAFFCVAVGSDPGWLYGLLPASVFFHPYEAERLVAQGQIIFFAALAWSLARRLKLSPSQDLPDADRALAAAARWGTWAAAAGGAALGLRAKRAVTAAWALALQAERFLAARLGGGRESAVAGLWLLIAAAAMLIILFLAARQAGA